MSIDDPRLEWLRDRVYEAFGLSEPECFEELLNRDDGLQELVILRFLNDTHVEDRPSVLLVFRSSRTEVEELEVEIESEEITEPMNDEEAETAETTERSELPNEEEASKVGASFSQGQLPVAVEPSASQAGQADGEDAKRKLPQTKIVTQSVEYPMLHVSLEKIPQEFMNKDALFFLRNKKETITEPNDMKETNLLMPKMLEFGMLNGNSLLMLHQILTQVFMPLLAHQHTRAIDLKKGSSRFISTAMFQIDKFSTADSRAGGDSRNIQFIRDEFLITVLKFSNQVQRTIQQVEGEIKLAMPQIDLDADLNKFASDPIMEMLDQSIMNWQVQISTAIEEQLTRIPQGNGPLAEIDFWRERNATLSALSEQLKLPVVKKIVDFVGKSDQSLIQNLNLIVADLTKYHVEAADNVRFLSTLERHFKNLSQGMRFQVVMDTIPSMMNALRMVWIISRHYNKDERMVPLMERIAWEISERVHKVINVRSIFKRNSRAAKQSTLEAIRTLQLWKDSYFDVRSKIEASGRDQRWEFDRKKLFEKTDYMIVICQNIHDILQTREEFYNIFGPELKAVTGDPKRIDDVVQRVNDLVVPIMELSFDMFNIRHSQMWKVVMEDFYSQVQLIEGEAKNFIDESFKSLRSAEAAFDMLLRFRHIRSREAVNKQMMRKFNDILTQYCKEVDIISSLFANNANNPPVTKNQPPVAGAIHWERSLFHRIKHVIVHFQEMPEMLASEQGKATKAKYLELAKRMKAYEDKLYEHWQSETNAKLHVLLKQSLLTRINLSVINSESMVAFDPNMAAQDELLDISGQYEVNFSPELEEIIMESKYMEQLGFQISQLARNVALQEQKFLRYTTGLKNMLNRYQKLMDSLSTAETKLMVDHIQELQRVIRSGYRRLNWNSLGIVDYLGRCEQAIGKFESLVNQIHKNVRDIATKLAAIESADLFKRPPSKSREDLAGVKEFYEHVERERSKEILNLVSRYKAIGPLLTKMEGLVFYTNTGKASKMALYYSFWEHRVYDSLVKMIIKNLQQISASILGYNPLFQIEVHLSAPEIVLKPNASEVYQLTLQNIKDCVETTKMFVRWMHGSCIECLPQYIEGDDEPVIFSFFSDISQYPQIIELAISTSQNLQKLLGSLGKFLNSWKKYRSLWKMDKSIVVEKFAARNPSCVSYDEKLQFYTRISEEVAEQPLVKDDQCIRLQLRPLAYSIKENANAWVQSLGHCLNESAKWELYSLRDELEVTLHVIFKNYIVQI